MSAPGVQCGCGWFLGNVTPWANDERLTDVLGDCKRCGPQVSAGHGDNAWWWAWDAWRWPEESADNKYSVKLDRD